jgi:hypothetical protein
MLMDLDFLGSTVAQEKLLDVRNFWFQIALIVS